MPRNISLPSNGCIQFVYWVVLIYCIWGLVEFKQVISPRKLEKVIVGMSCQNWTIDILQPYTPSDYRDCAKWKEYLPRGKFYCFQVELSNFTFVHLGDCFSEIDKDKDITEDYTVFTKDFTSNPFEISLFITAILGSFLFVTWAIWTLNKCSPRKGYKKISEVNADSNLVINIE